MDDKVKASELELSKYQFNPNSETNIAYHYQKSNRDGTQVTHVSFYKIDQHSIETIKITDGYVDAAWVTATMDWNYFSAAHLHSYWMYKDGSLKDQAIFRYLSPEEGTEGRLFDREGNVRQISLSVTSFPFHLYNFDLISFNCALPHLIDPKVTFAVELIDPNLHGPMIIEYLETTKYKGADCYKFKISGSGFQGQQGNMWMDPKRGIILNFEHPIPDNNDWNDFKFELQSSEEMTHRQWKSWVLRNVNDRLVPI